MVYYPIEALVNAGILEVMLVTGGESAGDFLRLLGNGKQFGLKELSYTYQEGDRPGIADALAYAEDFAEGDRIVVILGDNIIEGNIRQAAENFARQPEGAKILLKEVPDPARFGVPVFEDERIVAIEEKPEKPKSSFAIVGIYLYDEHVFDIIRELVPSKRGELEISDVNNAYIEKRTLTYEVLEGWWTDAGTFDSLLRANTMVAQTGANKLSL